MTAAVVTPGQSLYSTTRHENNGSMPPNTCVICHLPELRSHYSGGPVGDVPVSNPLFNERGGGTSAVDESLQSSPCD